MANVSGHSRVGAGNQCVYSLVLAPPPILTVFSGARTYVRFRLSGLLELVVGPE